MADEKVNFDEYSDRYQEHINDSIGASGESVAYFDEMKIDPFQMVHRCYPRGFGFWWTVKSLSC